MAVGGVFACALSLAALAQLGGSPAPSPLRTQITNLSDGFKLRPGERPLHGSESTAVLSCCGGPYRFAA